MTGVSGSGEESSHPDTGRPVVRLVVRHVLQRAGFWGTVGLPFIALGLLAVQPTGWVPLLIAVFLLNGVALFAGHCYSREC